MIAINGAWEKFELLGLAFHGQAWNESSVSWEILQPPTAYLCHNLHKGIRRHGSPSFLRLVLPILPSTVRHGLSASRFLLQACPSRRTVNHMNTAAVVLVSIFIGALFIVILGGLATLIYLHIQVRKAQTEMLAEYQESTEWLRKMAGDLVGEVSEQVSGARTSFSGIRTDIKAALESHGNLVADTLAKHEAAFQEKLGKINGAALEVACARAVKASNQIVGVATFLQKMLAEGAEPATDEKLAPDSYGPEDTVYTKQSRTAAVDEAIFALEDLDAMSEHAPVS
jgi:hypothetical protein